MEYPGRHIHCAAPSADESNERSIYNVVVFDKMQSGFGLFCQKNQIHFLSSEVIEKQSSSCVCPCKARAYQLSYID